MFFCVTVPVCLPCHPTSTSPQSRPDAEVVAETKAAEEFPHHLSSSEESTGSWSQLANDEDNPDDTSSYLQLSERSLRYVPTLLVLSVQQGLINLASAWTATCQEGGTQLEICAEYSKESLVTEICSSFKKSLLATAGLSAWRVTWAQENQWGKALPN